MSSNKKVETNLKSFLSLQNVTIVKSNPKPKPESTINFEIKLKTYDYYETSEKYYKDLAK